jgi:hypothetical protein
MSSSPAYEVEFQISKPAAGGKAGNANQYILPSRTAVIFAPSAHPHDLLAVLNADISLNAGEQINILSVVQLHIGSEGSAILQ